MGWRLIRGKGKSYVESFIYNIILYINLLHVHQTTKPPVRGCHAHLLILIQKE